MVTKRKVTFLSEHEYVHYKKSHKLTMRTSKKLFLILLSITVLMLGFFVSVARASNRSFVIGPMHGAVENVYLGVSDKVSGNLSVSWGYVDFFITNPDDVNVQEFLNVSNTSFNLVADKNGTYSMHLNNTYQESNVTVELDYAVSRSYAISAGLTVGSSFGVAQVIAPPPTRPLQPDDDNGPSDNLIGQYRNFLRAGDILNTACSARTLLPIRNVFLMAFFGSAATLTIIVVPRWRKPSLYAHTPNPVASPR